MVLISKVFIRENLTVRFAIPAISVIFKNSAAVTNTWSGCNPDKCEKMQNCKNQVIPFLVYSISNRDKLYMSTIFGFL